MPAPDHAGLRIVLGIVELTELAQLRRRVQELEAGAKMVSPVMFAMPGDVFTHHTILVTRACARPADQ